MENLEEKIQNIIQELLAYDPGFAGHENELKKIVRQLLESKPNTKFDQQFAENLRRQLLLKAEDLKHAKKSTGWKNLLVPAMAAAMLIVGGVYVNNKFQNTGSQTQLLSGKVEIDAVGKNAFGQLAMGPAAFGRGGGTESFAGTENKTTAADSTASAPAIAPTPNTDIGITATAPVRNQSGGGGADMKIMPPNISYRYIYKGEPIKLTDSEVNVYRREKGLSSSAAGQFIKQLKFGLLDLSKFNNVDVDSINLMEKREYGYNVMVNFREGIISVSENWELWPTPDKQCQTPECYESLRLKPADFPADEEIISLANKFLKDYGISTQNYGQPQVTNYWRRELAMATDPSQVYIPDVVTVVYPLILNGQPVFDEGGSPSGLVVNVNIRVKKASGIQELAVQKYQSSAYAAETDVSRILKLAENGGFRPIYYASAEDAGAKTEDVELGTPTKSLVRIWQYKNGSSAEVYVPALVFPVISAPKNTSAGSYFYKTNIVVPLAKEILDGDNGSIAVPLMK